jgi:hypothetical protein
MGDASRDGTPKPRDPGELRIWLVGGDRLASACLQSCHAAVLRPGDWRERSQDGPPPAFLLIEADSGVERTWGDELGLVLDHCERSAIPRLLWVAISPLDPYWLERCRFFERVFTMDREQLPELEAAGARMPSILWPAAAPPIAPSPGTEGRERSGAVVWLGGWRHDWPEQWRARLTAVLRGAAERDLRITQDADLEGLPADLWDRVSTAEPAESRESALAGARVVIGADSTIGSLTFAPPIAFDAIARGAAVITPHDFASVHDFGVGAIKGTPPGGLMPVVHDSGGAIAEIDRLLDEPLRAEVVSHLQRIVVHNHTHQHRLATLASAVDIRLTPDALGPTPA